MAHRRTSIDTIRKRGVVCVCVCGQARRRGGGGFVSCRANCISTVGLTRGETVEQKVLRVCVWVFRVSRDAHCCLDVATFSGPKVCRASLDTFRNQFNIPLPPPYPLSKSTTGPYRVSTSRQGRPARSRGLRLRRETRRAVRCDDSRSDVVPDPKAVADSSPDVAAVRMTSGEKDRAQATGAIARARAGSRHVAFSPCDSARTKSAGGGGEWGR